MKIFLDKTGLSYFWQRLKALFVLIDGAINQLNRDIQYNAIYTHDATLLSAPQNMPRGYNWRVEMLDVLEQEHDYNRYFYLSLEDAMLDNPENAVARWGISGRHVYFDYFEPVKRVSLTDPETGAVLRESFRPIDMNTSWYFGNNWSDPFPTNDNIRSILDINVWGLFYMMGNPFLLDTDNKEIVGAINELNAKAATVQIHEAENAAEALQYSQENPDVFVFVAREEP